MKVWSCGDYHSLNIGDKVTVFRCGSGRTTFGEAATLERTTSSNLVFITESGATVKTDIENLHKVCGKAAKAGYVVSLRPIEAFQQMIHEAVCFWDAKAMKFVTK